MLNVAVLVSGGGTNLQALLDSEARGENPNGKITLVVASKPGVYALERAAKAGVEGVVVRRKDYENSEAFDAALLETLKSHNIDLVVLAGFMTILTEEVGELARIMARTYGEQSFKESDKHRDLGDEMADVLWVLLCLANQTGVDLTAAFEKNLQKKTDRDKERHINNQKL